MELNSGSLADAPPPETGSIAAGIDCSTLTARRADSVIESGDLLEIITTSASSQATISTTPSARTQFFFSYIFLLTLVCSESPSPTEGVGGGETIFSRGLGVIDRKGKKGSATGVYIGCEMGGIGYKKSICMCVDFDTEVVLHTSGKRS